MTAAELVKKLNGETAVEALSALCALAKTKQGRAEIEAAVSDRAILSELVNSEQPKVRKNAYRLLGALENEADVPLLVSALESETTLFAVPSLLLSLGRLNAKDALLSYRVPVSESEATDKHIAEITIAYEKAMQRFETVPESTLERLEAPREVLCFAPHGFAEELKAELKTLGLFGEVKGDAVRVVTDDMQRVYRANCMTEALLPIAYDVPMEPKAIAAATKTCIGTYYRIEIRGYLKDRSGFIEKLKALLDGRNNPSAYDCELRIDSRNDRCDLYWKLWNVKDRRYPWRKGTLPASMHPALAYALSRYALSKIKTARPYVLDPFCGSGSLLFAAEAQTDCRRLFGVDKSSSAIAIARENAKAGGSSAQFICRDILRFEARNGADLVLSNLPFGTRVGSHRENETLYARFLKHLKYLLNDGGVAVLYTADAKLLERLIRENAFLKLREKRRTAAGGLSPWIFVIDKTPADSYNDRNKERE
ncbi:MAG: methyltransferase domain-containing protein [Clostridia bacterium]|nr:methyltransferase domain-containing protein [Clostridia bacterium]